RALRPAHIASPPPTMRLAGWAVSIFSSDPDERSAPAHPLVVNSVGCTRPGGSTTCEIHAERYEGDRDPICCRGPLTKKRNGQQRGKSRHQRPERRSA